MRRLPVGLVSRQADVVLHPAAVAVDELFEVVWVNPHRSTDADDPEFALVDSARHRSRIDAQHGGRLRASKKPPRRRVA